MQKRALKYALIILGIITIFLKPITNITGFSVASESLDIIGNVWFFVAGFGMIIVGIFMANPRYGITPKKDLSDLTRQERTFRRKVINLFEEKPNKIITGEECATILPIYDIVRYTGEHVKDMRVYQGKRVDTGDEEYFTIDDTAHHLRPLKIGDKTKDVPIHIDIQDRIDKNKYNQIDKYDIPWEEIRDRSKIEDIVDYFRRRKSKL